MRELHGVVQPAIGWEGIHLFEFAVRGVRYAGPDLSGASTDVVLLDFRFRRNAKFRHVYDMFCEWEHEIRVEERLAAAPRKRYPRCVGCAGAFPREPGPLLPRRPRRLISVERTRYPRFLGDPCVHAPLFDPGGPPNPGHYRTGDVVFRKLNDVDSAWDTFEALSRGDAVADPLGDEPTLEMGDRAEHMEHELAGGRGSVEAFLETHEVDALGLEGVDGLD